MKEKWFLIIKSISYIFAVLMFMYSFAAIASDFHSPRTIALGGAGHAGPLLNDSIFLNPSFASFLPTYSFGFNYLSFVNKNDAGVYNSAITDKGRILNVSIQDGRSEVFQAGAAYTQKFDGSYIHVGASKNFVNRFGFGIGGKFFFNSQTYAAGRDANVSMSFIVYEWLQSSLMVDNIFETEEGKSRGLLREITLGFKANLKSIVIAYFDPHVIPSLPTNERNGFESGLEFVFMSDIYLRVGYYQNSTIPYQSSRGQGFGTGIGWVAPRLSIDYGFSRALKPVQASAHTVGATVYF